jgi:arsenate reductase
MKVADNELIIIYNASLLQDRRALTYLKAQKDYTIRELDIAREMLTERQVSEVAIRMEVKIEGLLDKEHELFKKEVKGHELDAEGILTLIKNNPEILKTPIAVYQDRAEFISSSYEPIQHETDVRGIEAEEAANRDER